MTDENNQIKLFLYENWARTKTGQHTVFREIDICFSKTRTVTPSLTHNFKYHTVEYDILRFKAKNSTLKYFYLNAGKSTSLATAGHVGTQQII